MKSIKKVIINKTCPICDSTNTKRTTILKMYWKIDIIILIFGFILYTNGGVIDLFGDITITVPWLYYSGEFIIFIGIMLFLNQLSGSEHLYFKCEECNNSFINNHKQVMKKI